MSINGFKILAKGTPVKGTKNRKKNQDCNMFWEVEDSKTGDKFILMEVFNTKEQKNNYAKISIDKLKTVLKIGDYRPVYYVKQDGQIAFTQPKGKGKTRINGLNYMSQVILQHYGDNKVPNSKIIFINNYRLDNRTDNLEIKNPVKKITQNTMKISSKSDKSVTVDTNEGKNFPKELGGIVDVLPPYVLYCEDKTRKSKFFRIEKNPNFVDSDGKFRRWKSQEKKDISVLDKYKQTMETLKYIEIHKDLPKIEHKYPKYVSKKYNKGRKHYYFRYDKSFKIEGSKKRKRISIDFKISDIDNETGEYDIFRSKLKNKYSIDLPPLEC